MDTLLIAGAFMVVLLGAVALYDYISRHKDNQRQ